MADRGPRLGVLATLPTADLRDALRVEIERLLPTHTASLSDCPWEPLTVPEPCERCSTRIVAILWDGRRAWCEVTARGLHDSLFKPPDSETNRASLRIHTPSRCAAARAALDEPTQLDLLTGEPA